ncbi:MAG: hypothetical protein K2I00_07220 [Ruminococcus sp.]|nr:hypothetical protein [Ruminococcus sp.]
MDKNNIKSVCFLSGKLFRISAVCSAVLFPLTGCTFGANIDMLMTPPKLSIEQEQIYSALTDAAGESVSLKYPKSGKYLSAFIVEDIDGDSQNEAVVFYEKKGLAVTENTLRINILDRSDNGTWRSVYDMAAEGTEIERVMISRLGENERVNLIIGTSFANRLDKTATVYSYNNGILERTFSESYSFLDVTDLDTDGKNEFLLLKGASGDTNASAQAYKLDEDGRYNKYSVDLSYNFPEFDSVRYGIINGINGLYIDAVSGNGHIQTDVVYMDGDGMKRLFADSGESNGTLRPSGFSTYDVDGDGTLEIPVQTIALGYEEMPESEQLWLTDWTTITEKGRGERKYTSYYSAGDGYVFIFPEKWKNKVTVRRDAINDEIVICTYDNEKMGQELLRIYCAEDDASLEDRTASGYILLRTRGESAYLAYVPQNDNSGLNITQSEAAICFTALPL